MGKMSVNKRLKRTSFVSSIASGALLLLVSGAVFADRIAAGDAHNLAAFGSGEQYVWGGNANGQLGDGTTLDALNPVPVVDIRYNSLDGAIAVVSHGDNNLVLLDDATLLGWGPNEEGQLGSGLLYSGKYKGITEDDSDDEPLEPASTAIAYPTEVVDPDGKPISNITAIALGGNFAAAINQEGSVLVWGNLDDFQDTEESREPVNRYRDKFFDPNIEFIDSKYKDGEPAVDYDIQYMRDAQGNRYTNIISVAVGDNHLLALTNTGHVLAWGENSAGQLGDGSLAQRAYPVFVRNSQQVMIANIASIAAHGSTSMAVSADSRLLGWGNTAVVVPVDDTASLIASPEEPYARPMADGNGKAISGLRRVALGDSHMLGLTLDGRVNAWGSNSNGQLGDGSNFSVSGTATVMLGNGQPIGNIIEIAVGSSHSLALRQDGFAFAWGSGENGRLGDGTNIDSYYAVNIRDGNNNPFSLF
jgi:alpha-tubulin suppressor-like RCC1 family protein